jgi:transitional endoplasmic reticulum ATPase
MAKNDSTYKNVEFLREGTKVIIPEKMSLREVALWVERQMTEEERVVNIHETVAAFPLEGAYALALALKEKYGWTDLKPPSGFFDSPPTFVKLEIGWGQSVQVVWGKYLVPGIDGYLATGFVTEDGETKFVLGGQVKKKHQPEIKDLADLVRKIVAEQSIYRGKAISIDFPDTSDDDYNPVLFCPKFMDISKVDPNQLIFPDKVQSMVEDTLFTPILHTEACRAAKIPLKRGILLEGPYGVGKTLTQYVTAKLATESGWTYIYLQDINQLAEAMHFAKNFQPAIISAEDIDRADNQAQRSETMNQIMNTIDGVEFKDSEVIVMLTTNHVENIARAMLRPGRLDAVIPVRAPDQQAVGRLVKLYARDLLAEGEDLGGVGKRLEGQIPALIREVVERAKLTAINRVGGTGSWVLTAKDLEQAADGMIEHLKLMAEPVKDVRSDHEKAMTILGEAIKTTFGGGEDDLFEFPTKESAALAGFVDS